MFSKTSLATLREFKLISTECSLFIHHGVNCSACNWQMWIKVHYPQYLLATLHYDEQRKSHYARNKLSCFLSWIQSLKFWNNQGRPSKPTKLVAIPEELTNFYRHNTWRRSPSTCGTGKSSYAKCTLPKIIMKHRCRSLYFKIVVIFVKHYTVATCKQFIGEDQRLS